MRPRADMGRVISKTLKQIGATHQQIKKAATLSRVGMDTSQVYGSSAVGVDPKTTSIQKSNLAVATGTLYRGASRTLCHRVDVPS